MHPAVEFLIFTAAVALIFGLIELNIRKNIRDIEKIINSQE